MAAHLKSIEQFRTGNNMNMFEKISSFLIDKKYKKPSGEVAFAPDTAHNAASGVRPAMVSFKPLERPADSDTVGELSAIRARSRDIIRNSSIGAGIIKLMCRGVIGDGLKLMPAINGAVLGLSRENVKEIENKIES